jgi:HD-GYP domain-containing protein (c-di-GMP phosphodiesterase class II)
MRLVSVNKIEPQAYLAKTIYEESGRIILLKGTQLNENYIERLKNLDVEMAYIKDDKGADIEIDSDVMEDTRLQVFKIVRRSLPKIRAGESSESRSVRARVTDIIAGIMRMEELMIYLTDVKSLRDHTFEHSVNVCILALLTGVAMGYDQQKLTDLGIGALLHDVGKAAVLDNLVNNTKVFVPDEYKQIQKHAEYGYETLKKARYMPGSAAIVAWQHHERYNGNGYPMGRKGQEIHEFARITAIADVYNALASDRPYRAGMLPYEVENCIHNGAGTDFDPDIARELIRITIPYPLGSMVHLNTGYRGIVINVPQDYPTRPRIQLLYEENGKNVGGIQITDLIMDQSVFIQKLINN